MSHKMSTFIAAYITSNGGKEWEIPLCVEKTKQECKKTFCDWYANVDYADISVRYAPVTIVEWKVD